MNSLRVQDHLNLKVLVTRDSARRLRDEIEKVLRNGHGELYLDFADVDGITPSFLDEMLTVLSELASDAGPGVIHVLNPPTRLSAKFLAVGRSHGLRIIEPKDGSWILVPLPHQD